MTKRYWLIFPLLLAGLIWYFFIKEYDYQVSFRLKALPGTLNQSVKGWSNDLGNSTILKNKGLGEIVQQIKDSVGNHTYLWKIEAVNDSLSEVTVYARDEANSLRNKAYIPFIETNFETITKERLLEFTKKIQKHRQSFKVRVDGIQEIPGTYTAYVQVKGKQMNKAFGMMQHYAFLSKALSGENIELNGYPRVEVTYWNMETDSLNFNFCFPVIKSDSLPQHPGLLYKYLPPMKSIKATFNGNYVESDRAWYTLIQHAKKNGLKVTGLPIEIFHNNPNMGGDELQWTAEIYMPLKNTDD